MPKRLAFGDKSSEVVKGLAAYGRFTAFASAMGVTALAMGGVGVGVYLINKSGVQLTSVATATAPSTCTQQLVSTRGSARLERTCTTGVAYAAAGHEQKSSLDTSRAYASGDKLSVYYDPTSVHVPSATRIPGLAGWFVIGGSILVAILCWVWVFITRRYEVAAAATGANQALGALGFRRW
jgi:hypothetical protein